MTNAQETRPTARQIVRDDAEKFGWETVEAGLQHYDIFKRDETMVIMGWLAEHSETLAFASFLQVDGKLADSDDTVLCIVHAREWLAQEQEANATV